MLGLKLNHAIKRGPWRQSIEQNSRQVGENICYNYSVVAQQW